MLHFIHYTLSTKQNIQYEAFNLNKTILSGFYLFQKEDHNTPVRPHPSNQTVVIIIKIT